MKNIKELLSKSVIIGFDGGRYSDARVQELFSEYSWGGVIFFDKDHPYFLQTGDDREKNIIDVGQVTQLNADLMEAYPGLYRSIDVEGGVDWADDSSGNRERYGVNRLTAKHGFRLTQCAAQLGAKYEEGRLTEVKQSCEDIADMLSQAGFNLVYAPVADVNVNPKCPVIGDSRRSYSNQVDTVVECARMLMQACSKRGIQCCLKHYPGHGSAYHDTHIEFSDITRTWAEEELIPFAKLGNECGMIMTSHLYHQSISNDIVSQSKEWIKKLRATGFQGVIITDDIQMAAAIDCCNDKVIELARVMVKAWRAGNDMIILGRQLTELTYKETHHLMELMIGELENDAALCDQLQRSLFRVDQLKSKMDKLKVC